MVYGWFTGFVSPSLRYVLSIFFCIAMLLVNPLSIELCFVVCFVQFDGSWTVTPNLVPAPKRGPAWVLFEYSVPLRR